MSIGLSIAGISSQYVDRFCREAVKKEDVVVSERPAQRKAPSKRPKEAQASRAAKEDKQVDVEAAEVHEAQMRKSTRVRKPAIKEVRSHAPAEIAFTPTALAWHRTAVVKAVSEVSSRVCCASMLERRSAEQYNRPVTDRRCAKGCHRALKGLGNRGASHQDDRHTCRDNKQDT